MSHVPKKYSSSSPQPDPVCLICVPCPKDQDGQKARSRGTGGRSSKDSSNQGQGRDYDHDRDRDWYGADGKPRNKPYQETTGRRGCTCADANRNRDRDSPGEEAKSVRTRVIVEKSERGRVVRVSPNEDRVEEPSCMTRLLGVDEIKPCGEFIRQCEAEFWGTFFLVFLGVGSCVQWNPYREQTVGAGAVIPGQGGIVAVSLTFGLAVATIAQMLGHISGAHLNPSVTLGLVARGSIGLIKACCFILSQIMGAIFGSLFYYMIVGSLTGGVLGDKSMQNLYGIVNACSNLGPGVASWQGIFNECLITFPLIFVVCAVCDPGNDVKGSAPLAIGLSIALGHLVGIPASGASMNFARSVGPLVVSLAFNKGPVAGGLKTAVENIYVYLIGPILGGVLAGLYYRFRFASDRLGRNKSDGATQTRHHEPARPGPRRRNSD